MIDFGEMVKKWAIIYLSTHNRDWSDRRKSDFAELVVDRIAKDLVDTRMSLDMWARGEKVVE